MISCRQYLPQVLHGTSVGCHGIQWQPTGDPVGCCEIPVVSLGCGDEYQWQTAIASYFFRLAYFFVSFLSPFFSLLFFLLVSFFFLCVSFPFPFLFLSFPFRSFPSFPIPFSFPVFFSVSFWGFLFVFVFHVFVSSSLFLGFVELHDYF